MVKIGAILAKSAAMLLLVLSLAILVLSYHTHLPLRWYYVDANHKNRDDISYGQALRLLQNESYMTNKISTYGEGRYSYGQFVFHDSDYMRIGFYYDSEDCYLRWWDIGRMNNLRQIDCEAVFSILDGDITDE